MKVPTFENIVGQERPVSILTSAVASGRVHHACLFTGLSGVGKKQAAIAFAAALNCRSSEKEGYSCSRCSSCLRIASGAHPDVWQMEPDGQTIKIAPIRELGRRIHYPPFEGRCKVAILNQADRMSLPAQNALLKELEEPPSRTVIILLTEKPESLLTTVVSRCQRIRFGPLSPRIIAQKLSEEMGVPNDDPRLVMATILSEGSVGRALKLMEEGAFEERQAIIEALESVSDGNIEVIIELSEQLGANRERARQACEVLQVWYHDRLCEKIGWFHEKIGNHALFSKLTLADHSMRKLMDILEWLGDAINALDRNANPRLTMEGVLFRMVERR